MIEGMTFHHVGIACRDIDATAAHYVPLGYRKGTTVIDPLQNITICFLEHNTMPLLELLAPVDDNSPVVETLKKNGVTPYHICYYIPQDKGLELTMKELRRQRFLTVAKPKPACAIGGRRVAFMFHPEVGLIELLER